MKFTKILLLVGLFLVLSSFVSSTSSNLNCTYLSDISSCTDTKIIGIYDNSNSHVEIPSESYYSEGVCCKDDGPETKTVLNDNGLGDATVITKLSDITNAHVGSAIFTNSLYMNILGGNVYCNIITDSNTCQYHNYSTCVFKLNNDAGNTHVLSCDEPTNDPKLCCRLGYQDGDSCNNDWDCENKCDDDSVSNADDNTCFNPGSCTNGLDIVSNKCEYDDSCGADLVCDDVAPGDISPYDTDACCMNTCQPDYGFQVNWSDCEYYNSSEKITWCLDEDTQICYYADDPDSCKADVGWDMYEDNCPIPGTVIDDICYYNPRINRSFHCNGKGCNHLSKPIADGLFCDPLLGPSDVAKVAYLSKEAAKDGDELTITYYGKPGLDVSVDTKELGQGVISLTFDDQKYISVISVDSSSYTGNVDLEFEVISDGFNSSYKKENKIVLFNESMYVDNINPVVSKFNINDDEVYSNTKFVTLITNVSDNYEIGNCSYSLNLFYFDIWTPCEQFSEYDLDTSEGNVTLYLNVSDYVGNNIIVNDTIYVAENNRLINITTPHKYASGNKRFNFTDASHYSIDGGSFSSCNDYVILDTVNLNDGLHSIQGKKDWWFGGESYTNVHYFIVDNSNPYIELHSDLNNTISNIIEFTINDANLNWSKTSVTFDTVTTSFNLTNDCISNGQGGVYCSYSESNLNNLVSRIYISAEDYASNKNIMEYAVNYLDDSSSPVITIPNSFSTINNETISLDIELNELATCKASFYTGTYKFMEYDLTRVTGLIHNLEVSGIKNGNYTINFACQDDAKNIGINSFTFEVDNEDVSIIINSPNKYSNDIIQTLNITTDVDSVCRYDKKDTTYDLMKSSLLKNGLDHTAQINLENSSIYYVRCKDNFNNSNKRSVVVRSILDDQRPVIKFNMDKYKNTRDVSFEVLEGKSGILNLTVQVNGTDSSFDFKTDCIDFNKGLKCDYVENLIINGINDFEVIATDYANNMNVDSFNIDFDNINPTLSFVNANNIVVNNPKLILEVISDGSCRLSYNDVSYNLMELYFSDDSYTFNLHEGENNLFVGCSDFHKNLVYDNYNITLDTKLSEPYILTPVNYTILFGEANISFIDDLSAQTNISINGGDFVETSHSDNHLINTSRIVDGEIKIQLKSYDLASNIRFSRVYTFRIDNTPQSLKLFQPVEGSYYKEQLPLNILPNDDSIIFNISIYDGGSLVYSNLTKKQEFNVDIKDLSDGEYELRVKSYNSVNEIVGSFNVTFNVDNFIPIIINSDNFINGIVNVSILSDDQVQFVEMSINNVTVASDYDYPFVFEFDTYDYSNDVYDLQFYVKSKSGFTNSSSRTVTINNQQILITSHSNNDFVSGIINLTYSGVNLINPVLVINGQKLQNTVFNSTNGWVLINVSNLDSGLHQFFIRDTRINSNTITVKVEHNRPTTILEPRVVVNNGTFNIKVTSPDKTSYVLFYLNDSLLYNDTTGPFEYEYNNDLSVIGNIVLTAKSYDSKHLPISNTSKNLFIDMNIDFDCVVPEYLPPLFQLVCNSSEQLNYLFELSSDKSNWLSFDGLIDSNNLANGIYYLRITGTDLARNQLVIEKNSTVKNIVSGSFVFDKEYIKTGETQKVTVKLDATTYNVTIVSPIVEKMYDDGTNGDKIKGDGIYTYEFVESNINSGNVEYIFNITKDGKLPTTKAANYFIDNIEPTGSLVIQNGEEFVLIMSNGTNVSAVSIDLAYRDNLAVKACRVYYEKDPIPVFEDCEARKILAIRDGFGLKKIIYEIMDFSGNVKKYEKSITVVPFDRVDLFNDNTIPSEIAAITSYPYFAENKSFSIEYSQGYDLENYLLQIPLKYTFAIGNTSYPNVGYDNYLSFDVYNTTSNKITIESNSELVEGETYYISIKTTNAVDLFNVSSKRIYVDVTKPVIKNVTSNLKFGEWFNETRVWINLTVNDTSDIDYYLYSVDKYPVSNPILTSEDSMLNISDLISGSWYLHLSCVDVVKNKADTIHYPILIDNTRPTSVKIASKQIYDDMYFNWSDSFDFESGIDNYLVNITDTKDNSNVFFGFVNDSNFTLLNVDNTSYYIEVFAKNNAGLLSISSSENITKDVSPPKIILKTPTSKVMSSPVRILIGTDEFSICDIKKEFEIDYSEIKFSDGFYHTDELDLSVGTYTYNIICRDLFGNYGSVENITFDIDTLTEVSQVSIVNKTNKTFVGELANVTILVEDGLSNKIDDLRRDDFELRIEGEITDYSLTNLGGGLYDIIFHATEDSGEKDISVVVEDIKLTYELEIMPLTLDVSYISPTSFDGEEQDNYLRAKESNMSFGVATDATVYNRSFGSNSFEISSSYLDGYNYLYLTKKDANLEQRNAMLKRKVFDDLYNPSFGYASFDELDLELKLKYPFMFNFTKNMDDLLKYGAENSIKKYRLVINFVGYENKTPIFNVDVLS